MRFSFIVYAARSGSTFLAKQLAGSTTDLVVIPEFRLLPLLLRRPEPVVRALDGHGLRCLIAMDPQITDTLSLPEAALDRICEGGGAVGTRKIIEDVVREYLSTAGLATTHCVIKNGGLLAFKERQAEVFPDARYLHILRDGRGVVASLLSTEKAFFPGENMGRGDVIHCAKGWSRHLAQIERAELLGFPIHSIRFEALLRNPDGEVASALDFLGASPAATIDRPTYFRVGAAEKILHPNVEQAAFPGRSRAWQESLKPWQGLAVERWTRADLDRHGYDPYFLPGSSAMQRIGSIAWAWVVHVAASMRYVSRRVLGLWREPARLIEMGLLRRSRWKG